MGAAVIMTLGLVRFVVPSHEAWGVCDRIVLNSVPVAAGTQVSCGAEVKIANASVSAASTGLMINIVFAGVNQAMMQDAINRICTPGVRLSDQSLTLLRVQRQYFDGAVTGPVDIDDFDDFQFDGTLQATSNSTGYRRRGQAYLAGIAKAAADGLIVKVSGGQEGQNPCAAPVVPEVWQNWGRIAPGVGAPGDQVRFADVNGDLRADYLMVSQDSAVDAWVNQRAA